MAQLRLAPAHHWGQNFLIRREIFDEMAAHVVGGRTTTHVLEIGPGLGGLTLSLLEHGARVLAIELDRRVEPFLSYISDAFPGRLTVIYDDALTVSWDELCQQAGFDHVDIAGNLPYYATAPIMGRVMELGMSWERAVFMVQKEVAERLSADPGKRSTSTLGVLLRYSMDVSSVIPDVAPESFVPTPEVRSSVIQLSRRPVLPVDWAAFRWVVRAGFQHRRKMLRQALSRAPGSPWSKAEWQELLPRLDITPQARAEELALDQWVRLAAAVAQKKRGNGRDDI